ncbi:cation acetate symporter [Gracilibacillus sp. S3-1-1]|uniref:Cation acetate symporter n=1 Tax=Gracilibacillus pellucidus TaxID=3095368 RepID=A0ACC6M9A6_9BACI|nr:cation acetate symporter [Gracilibacillus sp. S3-1-1]MDX8047556.1 cation acetate symporter [Gracilibacillus sp. S3-1-1]
MNVTYFIFFIVIVIGTLVITHWAAERSKTAHQFYVAAGSLSGMQNGMAIAGDFISAASFLGITGLVAFYGYDGFLYATGFLMSYVILSLLIVEPIHRLGTYSVADVIAARFPSNKMRAVVAISGICISVLYMIPQLVASGLLIRLLLGVDFKIAVCVIGILMTVYVVFGGMLATSWVQIIKTVLLMGGTLLVVFIVLSWVEWDFVGLMNEAIQQSPYGTSYFQPGNLFKHPIEKVSLILTLILGTSGLPHILLRFLTVKNTKQARLSAMSASWIIGLFYLMTLILGIGTIALVESEVLLQADASGNLAALLLAEVVGGDFLIAFVMAVAFATIIAVVTGLVFAATSSFAHDIYFYLWKQKRVDEKKQLQIARMVAGMIGILSILISMKMETSNVAFLVSLTFAIAASTLFPLLVLTFYWERYNAVGAYTTIITGFIVSLTLVVIGSEGYGLVQLANPGILSIPASFAGGVIGTITGKKDEHSYQHLLRKMYSEKQEAAPYD